MRLLGRRALRALNALLGLGVVGYAFLFAVRGTGEARSAEEVVGRLPVALRRVEKSEREPSSAFRGAWALGIGGGIPEPLGGPVGPGGPDPRPDPVLLWTKHAATDPTDGVVHLACDGRPLTVRFGETVAGRLLVGVGEGRAVLRDPETGEELVLEVPRATPPALATDRPLPPAAAPTRFPVPVGEGRYLLPPETVRWIEARGAAELGRVELASVPRPAGGLLVEDLPADHLLRRLGIREGDVLATLAGRPVRSKKELRARLEDDGRRRDRHVLVLERDGREVSLVYDLGR